MPDQSPANDEQETPIDVVNVRPLSDIPIYETGTIPRVEHKPKNTENRRAIEKRIVRVREMLYESIDAGDIKKSAELMKLLDGLRRQYNDTLLNGI